MLVLGAVAMAAVAALAWLGRAHRILGRRHRALTADFILLQGQNDRLTEAAREGSASRDRQPFAPADQLDAVTDPTVDIRARAILNRGERHVQAACDAFVAARPPMNLRVYAQVALGELLIVAGPDPVARDRAFRAFNAKRPDLVIVDAAGMPLAVVEYQGAGHNGNGNGNGNGGDDGCDAARRDAVKRAACERAGVRYIEIADGATTAEISAILLHRLGDRLDFPGGLV